MGLPGIPEPKILGWTVSTPAEHLVLVATGMLCVLFVTKRIAQSPFGRILQGIREDETFVSAAGKDVASFKMRAFVLSAALAAIPGVLYAYYISFIDPSSFTVMESVFIISIVVIGGAGSVMGPILGAILLVILPELLRFVGLPTAVAANVRQILYGTALVGFMLLRPQGILGRYSFGQAVARE